MTMADWSRWFWSERIWLPPNVTWQQLGRLVDDRGSYGQFGYLWLPIPAAFLLILLRKLVERCAFRQIGIRMGLRAAQHRRPPTNDVLEAAFRARRSIGGSAEIRRLARQLAMTERQVERWIRMRKQLTRPTTLQKFSETGWRCWSYSFLFCYGAGVLWRKPWLWDIRHCWFDYPNHVVEGDIWFYYMVELTFYWSLTISQFSDAQRKDFWEMFVHHIITISLLCFSWTCNMTRVGTLALLLHDVADIWLEAAKMCKYTNYQRTCDLLFACFAITWIVTRLGVYPTWILYSTTIEAPQIVEMFPAYYMFNGMMFLLLVLHVVWTYFILKIVYKAVYSGKTEKDTRSDSSDETVSSSPEEAPANSVPRTRATEAHVLQTNGDSGLTDRRTKLSS